VLHGKKALQMLKHINWQRILRVKGNVRSCLIHGSETLLEKKEHEIELELKQVCLDVVLWQRKRNTEIRELLRLEPVNQKRRLRWSGNRGQLGDRLCENRD